MKIKTIKLVLVIIIIGLMASCASNRKCGGRKDCQGNKKTYNKAGGFWM